MKKPLRGTLRLEPDDRARILDVIAWAEKYLTSARDALAEEATANPHDFRVSLSLRLEYVRHRLRHCLDCSMSRVERALLLLTAYEHEIEGKEGGMYEDSRGDEDPPAPSSTSDVSK